MMEIINHWVLQALAMGLTVLLIPRLSVTSLVGPAAAVSGLAFINASLWDTALFLSVPDSFSTQAVSLLFCNGILFWVMVKLTPGINIKGFLPAIAAPLVFTGCNLVIDQYGADINWQAVFHFVLQWAEKLKTIVAPATT